MPHSNPYFHPDRVPMLSHVLLAGVRARRGRVSSGAEALLAHGASFAGASAVPLRPVCRTVGKIASELISVTGDRIRFRTDRRRAACHARQIAIYVCHVALRIPQVDVAHGFGRDRTTVRHACAVVEDRRDDPVYDDFVAAVERLAVAVFEPAEGDFDAED
ncbi:helix-turn-helix domain-containing protein [Gellertiella hungarica]|uniref:Chromosomal replication initiator DnaA C-terminal domain-containing protein n=1 Tax=Gellertiella hungarica TaxID=1572859 RepID=A0A7W6J6S0_9HYPH|nr:helix-turn-helix domain-containing protein [Gellertiella hungarica]MBB4065757.1 hypothetical protein [Gellertiella hungarica]